MTKLMPYIKSRQIIKKPAASVTEGMQQTAHGNSCNSIGPCNYMTPPESICAGLPASTASPNNFYNDIYPPDDYLVNQFLWNQLLGDAVTQTACDTGGPPIVQQSLMKRPPRRYRRAAHCGRRC